MRSFFWQKLRIYVQNAEGYVCSFFVRAVRSFFCAERPWIPKLRFCGKHIIRFYRKKPEFDPPHAAAALLPLHLFFPPFISFGSFICQSFFYAQYSEHTKNYDTEVTAEFAPLGADNAQAEAAPPHMLRMFLQKLSNALVKMTL